MMVSAQCCLKKFETSCAIYKNFSRTRWRSGMLIRELTYHRIWLLLSAEGMRLVRHSGNASRLATTQKFS